MTASKENYMKKQLRLLAVTLAAALALTTAPVRVWAQTGAASYYVRADGNDANDGLTEAAAFKTLRHALWETIRDGHDITTITVIGTLNQASEGRNDKDVFYLSSFGDDPILITGVPNAPAGRRAVLSAAGAQKVCVNVSGAFSPAAVRFEHIEISGSSKEGLKVSTGAAVTLGPGSVVRNNSDGGVWVNRPNDEFRDRYSPGHLILDGGIVENNQITGGGGGIVVNGAFTMKRGSVRNNTALPAADDISFGGGIYVYSTDPVSIEGGDISGNTAGMGGGIWIDEGSRVTMSGGSVSGNTATSAGGVFVTNGAAFTQRGGTVSGNTAVSHPDIYREGGSS
jgi:hypothetical protein